jgi:hypothetical protein
MVWKCKCSCFGGEGSADPEKRLRHCCMLWTALQEHDRYVLNRKNCLNLACVDVFCHHILYTIYTYHIHYVFLLIGRQCALALPLDCDPRICHGQRWAVVTIAALNGDTLADLTKCRRSCSWLHGCTRWSLGAVTLCCKSGSRNWRSGTNCCVLGGR